MGIKKTMVLLVVFLTAIIALPICHAVTLSNCRQVGNQIDCDSENNGNIHYAGTIQRRKSALAGLPEALAKGIELRDKRAYQEGQLAAQANLEKSQVALQEEQRKNLELDRKIKEEQLKQMQLQNAQKEVSEFSRLHKDFEQFRPAMYRISLNPRNANLTLQELYDLAKAGYTE